MDKNKKSKIQSMAMGVVGGFPAEPPPIDNIIIKIGPGFYTADKDADLHKLVFSVAHKDALNHISKQGFNNQFEVQMRFDHLFYRVLKQYAAEVGIKYDPWPESLKVIGLDKDGKPLPN